MLLIGEGILLVVICFVNQKGGVGKTASAVNIGAALAELGQKVLIVDLDPQESLSYWLGIMETPRTIYDVFEQNCKLSECIVSHTTGLDIAPSSEMLATISPPPYILKESLQGETYDYVILDCSPSLGMITLNALTAADWVVIPFCPDLLSIKGLSQLLGTIDTIRNHTNPGLKLKAFVATKYGARKKLHQDVLGQVRHFFEDVPIFMVRESIAVSESPAEGKSVLQYRTKSSSAQDYRLIARELLNG